MAEYSPPLAKKIESKEGYEVIGNIPTPYGSEKEIVPGMYFATCTVRKDSVAFYFFPAYTAPEEFIQLAPATFKFFERKNVLSFQEGARRK